MVTKKKSAKQRIKKEDCCVDFVVETGSGWLEEQPDDWITTETVIRETGMEVFGVSSGQRTDDKEICWLNKEVQATL